MNFNDTRRRKQPIVSALAFSSFPPFHVDFQLGMAMRTVVSSYFPVA
jgi:hypothetical protein